MSALTVVYLDSTRNVLAALTRVAPPGAGETVKAFVGTSLPVRGVGLISTHFALPASLLAVVTVSDTMPDVVIDPQAFQVVDDPQDTTLRDVAPFPPPLGNPKVSLTLDLTNGAAAKLQNVAPATSRQAVVVLQNVTTSPPQAATILGPLNVTDAGTPVAPASDFATGETWEFSAFVLGMPPNAISQPL